MNRLLGVGYPSMMRIKILVNDILCVAVVTLLSSLVAILLDKLVARHLLSVEPLGWRSSNGGK
jgi:hypothetical protein